MVEITPETLNQFRSASEVANIIVDMLPELVDEHEADLGVAALIVCGLIAGKLVDGGLPREAFMRQMGLAIDAKILVANTTTTSQ